MLKLFRGQLTGKESYQLNKNKCLFTNTSDKNNNTQILVTLWLQFFLLPFAGHGVNFLQTFTCHGLSFSMFTVLHRLFSLVLMFSRLRIEALSPSTVQGKCIYTFIKQRTSTFNFRSCVLNLAMINQFFLSKLLVPGPIYRPPVPSEHISVRPIYRPSVPEQLNRTCRFIGQTCLSDKIFGPIYQPTTAKGLKMCMLNCFMYLGNISMLC